MARILIVVTSHTRLGSTGRRTGFYFDEMAAPYYALLDSGHEVDIASIRGGQPAYDPSSVAEDESRRPPAVRRFLADPVANAKLAGTTAVSQIDPKVYDGIFLPGGHGTMWDFPDDPDLGRLVSAIHARGGVVGAVCHGPAGLVRAMRADGKPLVAGLTVNSFTDREENAVGLTAVVPFLLESRLKELGASFEGGADFTAKAVRDGRLVTGQNPMSVGAVAALMVQALAEAA